MAVITPLTGSDLARPRRAPARSWAAAAAGRASSTACTDSSAAIPTIVLWLIVVVWSIPTLGLFVNSWRSRDAQRTQRLVDVSASDDLTKENYDTIFGARNGLGNSLLNSAAIALPGHDHPDRVRRVRRLRLRLDRLPRPQAAVHRHGRAAGDPAAGRADPAPAAVRQRRQVHDPRHRQDDHDHPRPRPGRHDDRHVDHPHRLRHAVRHLPAAQLHQRAAEGSVRGGADRRRHPLHDLLAARAAAVGAGAGRRSPSSSSCGRGTTTWSRTR